jgi:hypothetical protein
MEGILKYRFDHEHKLVIETYRGTIELMQFIEYEKEKTNNPEYDDSYSIFIDIRDAIFKFSDEEKKLFYETILDIASTMNMNRKCAFLTTNPSEVASSVLFKLRATHLTSMRVEIFSTEEAALNWLKK